MTTNGDQCPQCDVPMTVDKGHAPKRLSEKAPRQTYVQRCPECGHVEHPKRA